jgi:dCTP deaminase
MAYWGTEDLKKHLPSCIDKYEEKRIDNAAYELSLGDQVYLTDSTSGKKELLDEKNSQVEIKPGQFALLLTEETVTIPDNMLAFISIKFGQKIKGLVNVSGFHVDPGFSGKIIFSVYNAGPAKILLDKGKPYFPIWFCTLSGKSEPYDGKHKGQKELTADHINPLKGELASPNVLLERIKSNEGLLKNIIWAAGITIGLGITLTVKSCWDTSKYNEGYNAGIKENTIKENIDKEMDNVNIDSLIWHKVDSMVNIRISNQNDTTGH